MPNARHSAPNPIATFWSPPAVAGQADATPLLCLATTYTFHATFFEEELLPRFLGLRFDALETQRPFLVERDERLAGTLVSVLVDGLHVDPRQSTLRWDQLPVNVPRGSQHSKVVLLGWRDRLRLIVSSANLTRSGYLRNREVAASFDFFDDAASAPRGILEDALDFLTDLDPWIRAVPGARTRKRETIAVARRMARRWRNIPSDFRPHERPRATFVPGLPEYGSRPIHSPLDDVLAMWGSRHAEEVIVMTPFVGDGGASDRVVSKLASIRHTRATEPALVVPGAQSERDGRTALVALPVEFRDAFARGWRREPREISTYVVPRQRAREKTERDLHAKALVIVGTGTTLLLCGSSNFSPHGMGVGATNIEANICYVDDSDAKRAGMELDDRLPVDWREDRRERTEWNAVSPLEDEEAGTVASLPDAFVCASYSARTFTLAVTIDPSAALPSQWSIAIGGTDEGTEVINTESSRVDRQFIVELPPPLRGLSITVLHVRWIGPDGVEKSGYLPVQVEDERRDLPAVQHADLSLTAILDILLSGRDIAEWVASRENTGNAPRREGTAYDSLRAIDTRGYLLYRTRRLGGALAASAATLQRAAENPRSLHFHLCEHACGPVRLSESLVRELQQVPASARDAETAAAVFSLVEIALTAAHVFARFGNATTRQSFMEAIRKINALRTTVAGTQLGDAMSSYVDRATTETAKLLGLTVGELDAG